MAPMSSPSRGSFTRALTYSMIGVTSLSILADISKVNFFFYPLFPGMAVSLIITGGHGGTEVQDTIALVAGFAINLIVYSLLFFWLMRRQRGVS